MHKALNDKPLTEDDITMIMSKAAKLVEKLEDVNAILKAEITKQRKTEKSAERDAKIAKGRPGNIMRRPSAFKRPAAADNDDESSNDDGDEDDEDEDD